MSNNSTQNIEAYYAPALMKNRVSISMGPRSVMESGRRTKATKRAASHDLEPPSKRSRLSEIGQSTTINNESNSTRTPQKTVPQEDTSGVATKCTDEEPSSYSVDTKVSISMGPRSVMESGRRTKATKRAASHDLEPPSKRSRLSEEIGQSTTINDESNSTRTSVTNDGEETSALVKMPLDIENEECSSSSVDTSKAEFEAKYLQQHLLGEGGYGSVYCGSWRADDLPVAIKHIQKDKTFRTHTDENGQQLPMEVAVMLKLENGSSSSLGKSSIISLLDWYDLEKELILVLERPVPVVDLSKYTQDHDGCLQENQVNVIIKQLIVAAKHLEENQVFHRDLKVENILIETGSEVPGVRLIDFGLSCFTTQSPVSKPSCGTFKHTTSKWTNYGSYKSGPSTVWQIGVVMFDSLHVGRFTSHNFLSNRIRISNMLSPGCQDFLGSCLSWRPDDRPTLEELQRHPWLL